MLTLPTSVRAFLDGSAAQQDYAWFLALLGWAAVVVLALRERLRGFRPRRAWTVPLVVAAASLVNAGIELWLHVWPNPLPTTPRAGWDAVLVVCSAVGIGALAWVGASLGAGRMRYGWFAAALLAVIAATTVRCWRPEEGSWLVLVSLGTALWALRAGRRSGPASFEIGEPWTLLVWGLLPLLAPHGPLAAATQQWRGWTELSWYAWPYAALQLTLACGLGCALWRRERDAAQPEGVGEWRFWAWVGLGWLLVGFVMADGMARLARSDFEKGLLARARMAAAMIDVESLAGPLGAAFQPTDRWLQRQPYGLDVELYRAKSLLAPELAPARHALRQAKTATPDVRHVQISTLRMGRLLGVLYPEGGPGKIDYVAMHRLATPTDLRAWAAKEGFFERPVSSAYGHLVGASAPLVTRDGRMLGWLFMRMGASAWTACQAQARMQALAIVALGLGLVVLMALQRLRMRERERAYREAAASAAADRAKTAFLAKVSHELRTPIQSILGYGEMLRAAPLEEPHRSRLAALRQQGELLIRLVNDLLDLSALQAGAFRLVVRPVAFGRLVAEVVESLRPRADAKGLALTLEVDPQLPPWVEGDGERLRQILLNLLGNALKFTAHGRVAVGLQVRAPVPTAVGACVVCELSVADTGPGIAEEDRDRLFRPFSRLDATAEQEGAGLGLALSAALCASMGGGLTMSSDGATGSTFTAVFPLRLATAPSDATATVASASLAGRRILVADDNTLVRELFTSYLTEQGASCEAVADGLAALDRCAVEAFDVLVLDLSMPWADGYEVLRRLGGPSGASRRPRIIGVSAHADPAERARALAAGMDVFLPKPVSLAELAAAVRADPPVETGRRGSDGDQTLQRRLEHEFARELPGVLAKITASLESQNWEELARSAHYLKNSADVLERRPLQAACARLMEAAARGDAQGAVDASAETRRHALTVP